jgi:hypothetical protein
LRSHNAVTVGQKDAMDLSTELLKGLGNLGPSLRREIYDDLRAALNLSEAEPMLPLPAPELATWSRRCAEIIAEVLAQRPATRMVANITMLEAGFLEYGKPPTDAFLDIQLAMGPALRAAGLSGLYVHAVVNPVALAGARRAAREVLPAALAALVEERYPAVVMLRHALGQEGMLGISGMSTAEQASSGA